MVKQGDTVLVPRDVVLKNFQEQLEELSVDSIKGNVTEVNSGVVSVAVPIRVLIEFEIAERLLLQKVPIRDLVRQKRKG